MWVIATDASRSQLNSYNICSDLTYLFTYFLVRGGYGRGGYGGYGGGRGRGGGGRGRGGYGGKPCNENIQIRIILCTNPFQVTVGDAEDDTQFYGLFPRAAYATERLRNIYMGYFHYRMVNNGKMWI